MASLDQGSGNARPVKSNYFRSLENDVAKRYEDKIRVIGGLDPYCIEEARWSSDIEFLPDLRYPAIVHYLCFTKSAFTLDEFRAYKSMDAFSQLVSGWVREVKSLQKDNYYLVSGQVFHSQRLNEELLKPWIIVEESGEVNSAHCTCMAGLGEACTHVAAVLFWIENAVRHKKGKSVTQEKAYWLPPTLQEVGYSKVCEIDFCTSKRKYEELQKDTGGMEKEKPKLDIPKQTDQEFSNFLKLVHSTKTKSAILSAIPPYSTEFVPPPKPMNNALDLRSYFNEQHITLSYEDLVAFGKGIELCVSDAEAVQVELNTKQQSSSQKWFQHRAGRITASKFKAACSTRSATSAPALVKSICYPESTKVKNKALEWGCRHEKTARLAYTQHIQSQHQNFKVEDAGFFINPKFPQFGATPDALISCDCCGKGCLEIKCPFCVKNTSIEENASKVSCLIQAGNGVFRLDRKHAYYAQVQAQMFICQKVFCDFVVWSPVGNPHIERLFPDELFWKTEEPKASKFFVEAILPELLGKHFSVKNPLTKSAQSSEEPNNSSATEKWCICGEDRGGKMIMCEKEGCKILWFHVACLKNPKIPRGKWYCAKCKPVKSKKL